MAFTIYIAGKMSSRYRLRPIKKKLQELGYKVLSKWMDPDVNMDPSIDIDSLGSNLDESKAEAERDSYELDVTDIFIIDTFDASQSGGREVELGMVLEKQKVKHYYPRAIFRVGPIRNVFHTKTIPFDTWDKLITHLKENFPND